MYTVKFKLGLSLNQGSGQLIRHCASSLFYVIYKLLYIQDALNQNLTCIKKTELKQSNITFQFCSPQVQIHCLKYDSLQTSITTFYLFSFQKILKKHKLSNLKYKQFIVQIKKMSNCIDLTNQHTNRDENKQSVKPHDFVIKKFGNKIYIDNFVQLTHESCQNMGFCINWTHQQFLKNMTLVQLQLHPTLNINILTRIISSAGIMQRFIECKKCVMAQIKPQDYQVTFDSIEGIKMTSKLHLYFQKHSPNTYAKLIQSTVKTAFLVCQLISLELQKGYSFANKKIPAKNKIQAKSNEQTMSLLSAMKIVEQEHKNFINCYNTQRKGQSIIRNPKDISAKKHAIMRDLQFREDKKVEISLKKIAKQHVQGSYSNVTFIQTIGTVVNTILSHRVQQNTSKQTQQLQNQEKITSQCRLCLICKTSNQKQSGDSSLRNQIQFLRFKAGLSKCPYVCNYYLRSQVINANGGKKRKILPQVNIKSETVKLYADYHPFNMLMIFSRRITMLDLINFAQQVMLGLIQFYLDNGFIHRDIKCLNIMLNKQGIIQIIDHGSIHPIHYPNASDFDYFMSHFDNKLRSTHYVKSDVFKASNKLIDKYANFTAFGVKMAVHPTFDVYSLGVTLQNIKSQYEKNASIRVMEVDQLWTRLLGKMTEQDFEDRISMQQALQQVRNIRHVTFGTSVDVK